MTDDRTSLDDYARPLLNPSSTTNNESSSEGIANFGNKRGLLSVFEGVLGWSPFITVACLQSYVSPVVSLGAGTGAAAFVLTYNFVKEAILGFGNGRKKWRPMILDVGQFLLFGSLFVAAGLLPPSSKGARLLVLWFNPITTGGMAVVMLLSVVFGRPFVHDFAEASMPPVVWTRLKSRRWFVDILEKVAMVWVQTLLTMTAIVSVQPALVTLLYDGDPKNDPTGRVVVLGNVLTVAQFLVLFLAMRRNGDQARARARARELREKGLTKRQRSLHGDSPVNTVSAEAGGRTYRIRSVFSEKDLDVAADIIFDAFRNDDTFDGYLDTDEGRRSFFRSSMASMAPFHLVLGCYDDDDNERPGCVMACLPVLSRSQEEMNVYYTSKAWKEFGFAVPGTDETNFPLPNDRIVELGEMKKRKRHGLTKRPYLYVAYFGADPDRRGRGYGRRLLRYVVDLADDQDAPLVLETTNATNVAGYERYGFEVVDRVSDEPGWVLMVRLPRSRLPARVLAV